MKSNLKFVLGLTMALLLLFSVGNVYAGGTSNNNTTATLSALQSAFNLITGVFGKLVGGPFWLHGIVAGATSAFKTYSALDQTIKMNLRSERVNVSDNEFVSEDAKKELRIDFDNNVVLTDQNVLDIDFIVTRKAKEFKDTQGREKSPKIRWAEKTETIDVIDVNNQKTKGQKRAILFEDLNQTIKQASEYRTLVIEYKQAEFGRQPVKITIEDIDDLYGNGMSWLRVFTTGVDQAKEKLIDRMDNLENVYAKREPNPSPNKAQKFRLLFNSRVDDNETISSELLDCTNEKGDPIGSTGTEVLPKVAYNWDFKENNTVIPIAGETSKVVNNTWCDVATNGIYCDATQTTIEVLQKINTINEFVELHRANFTCPTGAETQNLASDINNVGIVYLNVTSVTEKKATFEYKIRGNYQTTILPAPRTLFDINYTVQKKAENSFNWITIASGTKIIGHEYLNNGIIDETIQSTFSTAATAEDTIKIKVFLTNFNAIISNNEIGNNIIDNSLEVQTSIEGGTAGCTLEKTTENLKKYHPEFDEKLYNFKAYLMKDGYSNDFKKDFDEYYRLTFNTGIPNWYDNAETSYSPLYKYFIDPQKFKFKQRFANEIEQTMLPGPGRYNVKILIYYDDNWKLFNDRGDITGKIEIILDKEQNPELDSPLYYMPLDGMVGSTGDKTRNGYGVDYLDDKVPIFLDSQHNYTTAMFTEGYLSSNTISTIKTKEIKDFSTMNNGNERGKLLSITRAQNNILNLRYIPSRPTPVALKVTNTKANTHAYAFYKLSVGLPIDQGGEVATPGLSLANWTGIGASKQCRDFSGIPILERFLASDDLVSTESELGPVTQSQSHSYGVEWNKNIIRRTGNVWLYTIFYTPANFKTGPGISYLYIDSANDNALLFTIDNTQRDGSQNVALKNRFEKDIKSITDVFELVKNKNACIYNDSKSLDVFYNPKKISEPLTDAIEHGLDREGACIKH